MTDIKPVEIDESVKRFISSIFENYDKRYIKKLFSKLDEIEIAEFKGLRLPNYWITKSRAMLNHTTCNQLTDYEKFVYRIHYAALLINQSSLKNACGIPGDYSFVYRQGPDRPKDCYKGGTFEWSACKDSYVNFLTIVFCVYKQDKTREEVELLKEKLKAIFTMK
jgi:hypothetical protein